MRHDNGSDIVKGNHLSDTFSQFDLMVDNEKDTK